MSKLLKIFLACIILTSNSLKAGIAPLSEADGTVLINKIRSSLANVQTLKLAFEQKRVLKMFKDELRSRGLLYFQQPSKLRWEVLKPFKTLLIYNDKGVGKFTWDESGKRWSKMEFGGEELLREIMNNILAWHRGDFSTAKDMYQMEVYPEHIALIPKSEKIKLALSSIDLHFDPQSYRMQKVVLNESKGDFVEISFATPEINPVVTEKVFDLKNPSN